AIAALPNSSRAGTPSLGQLNQQLGQAQARQQSLASSLGALSQAIASLDSQIALVQSREAAVRADLQRDQARLSAARLALRRERRLLVLLVARLARARMLLARQLVSSYEGSHPDLVSVVLEARGFKDLLDKLAYLHDAEHQQQSVIKVTRAAKAQADAAARALAGLEATDRAITTATALRARALAGMNTLLSSKQGALQQARSAQQTALAESKASVGQIQAQISQIQAQQAAAAARAAAAAQAATNSASPPASSGSPTPAGPSFGPNGGWAIPYSIVLCESGGQNLTPNSAGASGYYQIIPSTWVAYGGTGPAAYLASKAEQDAVASRIWDGGRGASAWVCAGIVGIH
ncbi:MAG TPA: transglycosylase family protein, partial [Solirubrobacteraceae bacterium]